MTTQELLSLLIRTGLSNDEAKVLLTAYRHPGSSTGRLAQFVGYKRGHTYNLVASLLSKGLVSEVEERGIMRITGIPPSQLPTKIEKKRDDLTKLLIDLNESISRFEGLIPKLSTLPRVQVFRGAHGLMELYDLTLRCKEKVIRACADFANLFPRRRSPELNDWLWRYAERRARKGIIYKGILTRSKESDIAFKKRRAQKRELRLLENCSITVEINIFDNFIAISSSDEEMMGVLIESSPISSSAKNLFEILWGYLPPYNIK